MGKPSALGIPPSPSMTTSGDSMTKTPKPRSRIAKRTSIKFTLNHSTHSLYETSDKCYYGPYAHIRQNLDYNFHNNYTKERQWLQDSIIDKLLNEIVSGKESNASSLADDHKVSEDDQNKPVSVKHSNSRERLCSMPVNPWLVYIAGTEKANRTMTIKYLLEESPVDAASDPGRSRFPLFGFVLIDSREINQLLPEYQCYAHQLGSKAAGELTRKEVGYISEIVTRAALQAGSNVLIYGALRDSRWYHLYFKALENDFDHLKIGILHIVAPEGEFEEECHRTAKAIEELIPNIHFFCKLQSGSSSQDVKILSDGITWDSFRKEFMQECAFVQETIQKVNVKHRGESGFIREFSVDLSTEENHHSSSMTFYGPHAHIRKKMDYNYHRNYKRERQMLQDAIIEETLNTATLVDANSGETCTTPTEPFLVFTAGAMGAGKSFALRKIHENGRFPLPAFVVVDPDEIRQLFPEYGIYVAQNPSKAGELTRKEAGYIVEILTLSALQAGKNVLVDGSLRDWEWYSTYFDKLRMEYPSLKIALLHVVAPKSAIFARAKARGEKTGRVVPTETLELAFEEVPKSVEILRNKVDYYCRLNNAPFVNDIEIMTDGVTWESFTANWQQTCAWIPKSKRGVKKMMTGSIVSNNGSVIKL